MTSTQELLQSIFHEEGLISARRLTGGDINDVYYAQLSNGECVVKVNHATRYPKMFEREKDGLHLLKKHSSFVVPEPFRTGVIGDFSYLAMEYIQPGGRHYPNEEAGRLLAQMHEHSSEQFGLESDNYIGSLPQNNDKRASWSEFFMQNRILPLLSRTENYFSTSELDKIQSIGEMLDQYFDDRKPSLLHGDLWSGNTFTSENNRPVIIDPAVYFGHPFMDLGMTRLFGGFGSEFYEAYGEISPLPRHWQEACDIANLYPLFVHLALFGGGYKSQITSIVNRYF